MENKLIKNANKREGKQMTYRMESGNLLYAKPSKCTSKMAQFAIPLFRVVKRVLTNNNTNPEIQYFKLLAARTICNIMTIRKWYLYDFPHKYISN